MHTHTGKSLFKYALTAKNTFILALIMLAIGVAAELAGPFIARTMIDDHMLAIEKPFLKQRLPATKPFLMTVATTNAATGLQMEKHAGPKPVCCRSASHLSS